MKTRIEIKDIVLLITGCINAVKEQKYHTIYDCTVRYEQYMESIVWAIENTGFTKIVFCENSNFFHEYTDKLRDILTMQAAASKRGKELEILSFQGDSKRVQETNKGYGEGEIIEYALRNSSELKSCSYFCKLTGRLKVRNIDRALTGLAEGKNCFNRDKAHARNWIDTRFFCCSVDYYRQYLIHQYQELTDKIIIEKLFYYALKDKKGWRSTYSFPNYEGKSGATGLDYRENKRVRLLFLDGLCSLNLYNNVYIPLYYDYILLKEQAYRLLK